MKDENAFNRYLGKELTKLSCNNTFYTKVADKFRTGVSDFIIWSCETSLAMESKFIKTFPTDKSKLLKHPFSGQQITYMESVDLTGNFGFGLVGVYDIKKMYTVHYKSIPEEGNWNTGIFKEGIGNHIKEWDFKDVELMLNNIMRRN